MLLRTSKKRLLWLFALVIATARFGSSVDCYPKSQAKLPRYVAEDNNGSPQNDEEVYRAIVSSKTSSEPFVIYGGRLKRNELNQDDSNKHALIARMDLDLNVERWLRTYCTDDKSHSVEALALSPDETKVSVYVRERGIDDWTEGKKQGYIFIIKASDGGLISRESMKLKHSDDDRWGQLTSSSAMTFKSNTQVYIAFWLSLESGQDAFYEEKQNDVDPDRYEGRLRIAKYVNDSSDPDYDWKFEWIKEHKKYFGVSSALASKGWQSFDGDVFIGGAADNNRYNSDDRAMEWAPIIYQLKKDGTKYKYWKLKIGGSYQSDRSKVTMVDHLKLMDSTSEEYLFGTTRTRYAAGISEGLEKNIYIFRLQTKGLTDHNLSDDSADILIRQLEYNDSTNPLATDSHIVGLHHELSGTSKTVFRMIMFDPTNQEVFYVHSDISSTTATMIRLYVNVPYISEAAFGGGNTESYSGVSFDLEQGYMVGYVTGVFFGDSAGNERAVIMPILPQESCNSPAASQYFTIPTLTVAGTTVLTEDNSDEFYANLDDGNEDFGTDSNDESVGFSLTDDKTIVMQDINYGKLYRQSTCTQYTTVVEAFDPPVPLNTGTYCSMTYDRLDYYIDFTPPVITTPSCDTTSNFWTTWLEPLDNYDSKDDFKIAIDIATNKIRVTSVKSSQNSWDPFQVDFKAHFMSPDGVDYHFQFRIEEDNSLCTPSPFTDPGTAITPLFNYAPGAAQQAQPVGQWVATGCTPIYTLSYSGGPIGADYSFFSPYGSNLGAYWSITDSASTEHNGMYSVVIQAQAGCQVDQLSWSVLVGPPTCATSSIDISTAKFASPAMTYIVSTTSQDLSYTDADAPNSTPSLSCGALVWSFTMNDGTSLVSFITEDTLKLVVDTDQIADAGTYNLKVTASYSAYPAVTDTQDFTIVVVDPCLTATITTTGVVFKSPPVPGTTQTYTIGDSTLNLQFDYSVVTHDAGVTCPAIQYSVHMADNSGVDTTVFTFTEFQDATTGQLDVHTVDRSKQGDYNMKLYIRFTGYSTGEIELFTVSLDDPCSTYTIAHDTSPFTAGSYELGQPAAHAQFWSSALTAETLFTLTSPTGATPIDCGDVVLTFEQALVVSGTTGTFEDVTTATPSVFTVDQALTRFKKTPTSDITQAGVYQIKYTVELSEYPLVVTAAYSPEFTVTIIDPCATGVIDTNAASQPTPAVYYYSDSTPKGEIVTAAFTETSNGCPITYSCSTEAGPTGYVNICSLSGATNSGIDTTNGKFTFISTDVANYPEGDYTIRITGTAGNSLPVSDYHDFTFTLSNPCKTATVNHRDPGAGNSNFDSISYTIGDALESLNWDPASQGWADEIANLSPTTPVDCGPWGIKLLVSTDNWATSTEMDSDWILEDFANNQLQLPQNTVVTDHGTYAYAYKVYLVDYIDNYPTAISSLRDEGKSLTIIDPCLTPTLDEDAANQPTPTDYEYTGSAAPWTYTIQPFIVNPASCEIIYQGVIPKTYPAGTNYADLATFWTYSTDTGTSEVTTTDMATYVPGTYVLTYKAFTGTNSDVFAEYDVAFDLIDPCYDTFQLTTSQFDTTYEYFLRDAEYSDTYSNPLAEFDTAAVAHCGTISYTFLMDKDGGGFGSLATPFSHVANTALKLAYTEDVTHAGVYTFKYQAQADNYSSEPVLESGTWQITITDPCKDPHVTLSTIGLSFPTQEYTITQAVQSFTIPDYIVYRDWCDVTYAYSVTPSVPSVLSVDADNKVYSFQGAASLDDTRIATPFSETYVITVTGQSDTATADGSFSLIVKNPCIDSNYNNILMPEPYTVTYEVQRSTLKVDYSENYFVTLALCGDIDIFLKSGTSDEITDDPPNHEISIYTADPALIGTTQTVVVGSYLTQYQSDVIGEDLEITVEFIECIVDDVVTQTIDPIQYQIGNQAVQVPITSFSSPEDVTFCNYSWVYAAQLETNPFGSGTMADYITFDPATMIFTIESDVSVGVAQTLKVVLTGTLDNGQEFSTVFDVEYTAPPVEDAYVVETNLDPEFVQSLEELVVLDFSASSLALGDLGQLVDYEGDPFTVAFSGDSTSFVSAQIKTDGTIFFDVDKGAVSKDGNYTLDLTVEETKADGTVKKSSYSLTIEVIGLDSPESSDSEDGEQDNAVEVPIIEFSGEEDFEKPERPIGEPPTMKIRRISKYGIVEVDFNQSLFIPANTTHVNSTVLEVYVTAANEDWQELKGIDWKLTSFGTKTIILQLTFEYPHQISNNVFEKDKLSIKVLDPTKFLSKTSFQNVKNETVVEMNIPQQIAPQDQETVQAAEKQAEVVASSSSVLMGSSFAMNILLASSLSLLWGLIHALQLVTHFPLLNVQFPETSRVYYDAMLQLATLDMIPTDQLQEMVDEQVGEADESETNFNAEQVLSATTIDAGYDNSNVVLNSIFNLIILAVISSLLLVMFVLRIFCFKFQRVRKCLTKIWRSIFWNFIIRTTMETYLELAIVNMIKMHAVNDNTWFESIGSVMAISVLSALTIFSIATPFFLYCKRKVLKTPEFIEKYGSLTIDLRIDRSLPRVFVLFFTMRRLVLSALIVFFTHQPNTQIMIVCFACSIQIIYIGYSMPFTLPWMNKLEVANEYLVLTSTYFLFIYSEGLLNTFSPLYPEVPELVKDLQMTAKIGWANTGLLGSQVLLNLVVMLTAQIAGFIRSLKLRYLKRQHAKRMKEHERRQELKQSLVSEAVQEAGKLSQLSKSNTEGLPAKSKKRNGLKRQKLIRPKTQQQINAEKSLQQIPEADSIEENASLDNNLMNSQQMLVQESDVIHSVAMEDLESEVNRRQLALKQSQQQMRIKDSLKKLKDERKKMEQQAQKNRLDTNVVKRQQTTPISNNELQKRIIDMENTYSNQNRNAFMPPALNSINLNATGSTVKIEIPDPTALFSHLIPKNNSPAEVASPILPRNAQHHGRPLKPFDPINHKISAVSRPELDYLAVASQRNLPIAGLGMNAAQSLSAGATSTHQSNRSRAVSGTLDDLRLLQMTPDRAQRDEMQEQLDMLFEQAKAEQEEALQAKRGGAFPRM